MTAPQLTQAVQGESVISADLMNTWEQTCNNVEDLRGFIGTDGIQVYMRGYVVPNDGGQGQFYWNVNGTGPDNDGVTAIVPNGAATGCWQRITDSSSSGGLIIGGSVTGTNAILFTQFVSLPTIASYTNYQLFSFVAAATSTNSVTFKVGSLAALNAYLPGGTTQAGANSFILGASYILEYNSALNSSAGGFVVVSVMPSFIATDSNIPSNGIYLPAANTVGIAAGSLKAMTVTANAGASNSLSITATATGQRPIIAPVGDVNVGLNINAAGNADVLISCGKSAVILQGSDTGAFIANRGFFVAGSYTGSGVPEASGMGIDYAAGVARISLQEVSPTGFAFTTAGLTLPQFSINHTASSNRYISVTGANSAAPTLSTNSNAGLTIDIGTGILTCAGVNSNTTGSAANVNVDGSGLLKKATSSRRYKKNIRTYTKGLADVLKLKPKFYKSKAKGDGDRDYAGLIAEDVDKLGLKEFVAYDNKGRPDQVYYQHMIALLVSAIQEQQKQINFLKKKL